MENSILLSVKDYLSVSPEEDAFDQELILHINSAFMILRQLGVGPETPFVVEDETTTWQEFTDDDSILPVIKSYVTLKVRTLFDSPNSSSLSEALKNAISEYEWRLGIECDTYKVEEDPKYARRT